IDSGQLAPEQWRTHPERSLLTRALGVAPVVDLDLSRPALVGGARLLLCTDGLTAQADEAEIAGVLAAFADPDQAAVELVRLANRNGEPTTPPLSSSTSASSRCPDWPAACGRPDPVGRRRMPASGAGEDDKLLGRPGHRDVAVDRSLDARAERLRVDENDQVELEPLRQLRGQRP